MCEGCAGLGQFNDHELDNLLFQQSFFKYLIERSTKCYLTTESRVRIWLSPKDLQPICPGIRDFCLLSRPLLLLAVGNFSYLSDSIFLPLSSLSLPQTLTSVFPISPSI